MDLTIGSTSIAWAVPVKPEELGPQLESFKAFLPTLTTLRMCHRYGKGPDVHITKLPPEILDAIETILFRPAASRFWNEWEECFEHFKGECAPIDHFYDDRRLDVIDKFRDLKCTTCQEEGSDEDDEDGWNDCEECYEHAVEMANEDLMDVPDGHSGECQRQRSQWTHMINQGPKGHFAQYDEILFKHFGLQAFFATTRRTAEDSSKWKNHPNYKWHVDEEVQTTICYLTLPRLAAQSKSYLVSELEAFIGEAMIHGLQSSFIKLPDPLKHEKRIKQFRKALRTLKLKPYIHPSQLHDTLDADAVLTVQQFSARHEGADQHQSDKDLENVEWPQLVVLVNSASCL